MTKSVEKGAGLTRGQEGRELECLAAVWPRPHCQWRSSASFEHFIAIILIIVMDTTMVKKKIYRYIYLYIDATPSLRIHVSESKATNQEAARPASRGRRVRSATEGGGGGRAEKRRRVAGEGREVWNKRRGQDALTGSGGKAGSESRRSQVRGVLPSAR